MVARAVATVGPADWRRPLCRGCTQPCAQNKTPRPRDRGADGNVRRTRSGDRSPAGSRWLPRCPGANRVGNQSFPRTKRGPTARPAGAGFGGLCARQGTRGDAAPAPDRPGAVREMAQGTAAEFQSAEHSRATDQRPIGQSVAGIKLAKNRSRFIDNAGENHSGHGGHMAQPCHRDSRWSHPAIIAVDRYQPTREPQPRSRQDDHSRAGRLQSRAAKPRVVHRLRGAILACSPSRTGKRDRHSGCAIDGLAASGSPS